MPQGLPSFVLRMDPLIELIQSGWVKGAHTALAVTLFALLASTPANAQESPDSFTLPEGRPSPTPSPAPQGPEDERSGVPIAPRLIDPAREQPAPERVPAQTPPAQDQTPTPQPTATPTEGQSTPPPSFLEGGIDEPLERDPPTEGAAPENESLTALQSPPIGASNQGQASSTSTSTPSAVDPSVSEIDAEWVDASPNSIDAMESIASLAPTAQAPATTQFWSMSSWNWVLLSAALLLLGMIAWLLMRARRVEEAADERDFTTGACRELGTAFATRESERSGTPKRQPGFQMDTLKAALEEEPTPSQSGLMSMASAPQRQQPKTTRASVVHSPNEGPPMPLSASLSITSARRSVMMFTLEYRVDLANRGDKPLRDLTILGTLTCAQAGASQESVSAPSHVLGQIDRIGSQQIRAVTGSLEMPLADVRLIRQGAASVFIPLMIVNVEGEGWSNLVSRFVVGTPSPANPSRLQPIAFDTRIGGLGTLRADKIQSFAPPSPSSVQAESSAVS